MSAPRRMGTETSATRAELIEITERVMIEDGYAAVSSRRIAKEAGVTAALVHYYFGTLDDLFIAVLRRRAEQQLERQRRFLSSPRPLRSWWRFASDPAGTALLLEFMALSNHRKSIRGELATYAERFRQQQVELLSDRIKDYGVNTKDIPPVAVLVVIDSIGKTVVMEEAIGMHTGLPETIDVVERYLDRFEGPADPKERRRPRKAAPRRRSTKK